ncbi:allophanate hydrolase [Cellvibrio japonicus]|uniref:Urea amidolyase n=1 Tax=Cellvibrio japonicus (strain Ueda107) TaxID=498211 RepID=B3PCC8_CELJU|nr:allophanate hydrolase [Cellvibrio japonicus]ACE84694.1 urea amidolyase [Cellvibrio japonicus Ueda107]QEI11837.1 allophanate hydrolase [Cellvibrio japonicus]QEI15411.1 allophanate hydrolase [Cellvibrio japonicus]QEI18990.1 allophanate hydrolase [Cellvibrio japonicus]
MNLTHGWTITEWLEAYRSQSIEPRAALQALRAQITPADPTWIYVLSASELNQQLDALSQLGDANALPLYGVPFAVKDNIDVAGIPTTAACPAFTYIPSADATSVARLKAAGAIVLGKTNLDQFATGLVGTRSPYGAVPNSFKAEYVSGGSSSGSATSVAQGLVPFSLGTDTAGSGRVPAGFNNVVGLKPTKGRFSTQGVVPACRSLDCVSIFALTVDDANLVAQLLQGFDQADGYSRQQPEPAHYFPATPRVAIPAKPDWYGDSAAEAAWQTTLQKLQAFGVELVELDFTPMFTLAQLLYGGPWVAERHAAVAEFMRDHAADMNPVVRGIIENAANFSATDTYRAEYRRADFARVIQTLMQDIDALLVPTAPRHPTIAQVETDPVGVNSQLGTYTNFVNLADCSALAVPAGMRSDGLPFGITLIAPAWQDDALVDFGRRWHASLNLPLGATDRKAPAINPRNHTPAGYVRLAVVGAHLTGMPLNVQLQERKALFVESTFTASHYRLFALPNTTPPKPGLIRTSGADQAVKGAEIIVELWDVPLQHFGSFVALIPAPLGIGTLTLKDGREVKGFICEGAAIEGATEITRLGGWRAYIASLKK